MISSLQRVRCAFVLGSISVVALTLAGCASSSSVPGKTGPGSSRAGNAAPAARGAADASVKADYDECVRRVMTGRNVSDFLRKAAPERRAAWERAAAAEQPEGLLITAICRLDAIGQERDLADGWRRMRGAADLGLPMATLLAGRVYMRGMPGIVDVDLATGRELIRKAADANFAPAMADVGAEYAFAIGVERDDVQAVEWYRKGMAAGDTTSMRWLALALRYGVDGAPHPFQETLDLYQQAAKLGDPIAMTSIGATYETGGDVPRDYAQAMHWYRAAADAGSVQGIFAVARMSAWGWA